MEATQWLLKLLIVSINLNLKEAVQRTDLLDSNFAYGGIQIGWILIFQICIGITTGNIPIPIFIPIIPIAIPIQFENNNKF